METSESYLNEESEETLASSSYHCTEKQKENLVYNLEDDLNLDFFESVKRRRRYEYSMMLCKEYDEIEPTSSSIVSESAIQEKASSSKPKRNRNTMKRKKGETIDLTVDIKDLPVKNKRCGPKTKRKKPSDQLVDLIEIPARQKRTCTISKYVDPDFSVDIENTTATKRIRTRSQKTMNYPTVILSDDTDDESSEVIFGVPESENVEPESEEPEVEESLIKIMVIADAEMIYYDLKPEEKYLRLFAHLSAKLNIPASNILLKTKETSDKPAEAILYSDTPASRNIQPGFQLLEMVSYLSTLHDISDELLKFALSKPEDLINLKVQFLDQRKKMEFKIDKTKPISELIKEISEYRKISVDDIFLQLDGEKIDDPSQSPVDLDLEEGYMIDVHIKQNNGKR